MSNFSPLIGLFIGLQIVLLEESEEHESLHSSTGQYPKKRGPPKRPSSRGLNFAPRMSPRRVAVWAKQEERPAPRYRAASTTRYEELWCSHRFAHCTTSVKLVACVTVLELEVGVPDTVIV